MDPVGAPAAPAVSAAPATAPPVEQAQASAPIPSANAPPAMAAPPAPAPTSTASAPSVPSTAPSRSDAVLGPSSHALPAPSAPAPAPVASAPISVPAMAAPQPRSGTVTPTTHSAAPTAPSTPQPPQGQGAVNFRPLNVRDALSYLDEVKAQFQQQPEVYNRFLDIMKDFKTQNIDTPGVIDRVSSLFRGHPALIQGFNTFLPPGYRIECSIDAQSTSIIVTTPQGTTTQRQASGLGPGGAELTASQRINGVGAMTVGGGSALGLEPGAPSAAASNGLHIAHMPDMGDGAMTPSAIATPGAANVLLSHQAAPESRPPLEFNHAISYVNKIKQRFANDQHTYKVFLEILQTYQREQRPIQDVYAQVTQLFVGAPDLLDEFKQFLPDTSAGAAGASGYAPQPLASPPKPKARKAPRAKDHDADATGTGKKRRGGAANGELTAAAKPRAKRTKVTHGGAGLDGPDYGFGAATSMRGPHGEIHPGAIGTASMLTAAQRLHGVPNAPLVTIDELAFFDRAKKHIEDRATYHEFLKLLSLFTHDIIDLHTLVNKAFIFVGADDGLFAQFKEIVGWDPTVHGLVEFEEWIVDNPDALERPKLELLNLPGFGPSYRRLPQQEVDLACSGRDPLCWSVLNDEWVAHATWASEGAGAHKKTAYEDALFLSEQERHWFDVVIEVNARALAALEPVAQRIAAMPAEVRASFRLEVGLGMGVDKSIYERAIKKCYGADATQHHHTQLRADTAWEVINGLYENPAVVVPVVVRRLKQKDEEWRRARREWNRVWREVDAKNYYRSLDHQGVSFKANDRKATTTKALVAEIETLRADSRQKRIDCDVDDPVTRPRHQFELKIDQSAILLDVLRLTLSYLDRLQGGFSASEKDRVEAFLRSFVPLVFGIAPDVLDTALGVPPPLAPTANGSGGSVPDRATAAEMARAATPDADESDADMDLGETSDAGSGSDVNGRRGRHNADDLRKRLLSKATAPLRHASPAPDSRATSPLPDMPLGGQGVVSPERRHELGMETTWIRAGEEPSLPLDRRFNFFAGTTAYCLVRLIHMLYHRLLTLKSIADEQLAANRGPNPPPPRINPLAVELGLSHTVPVIDAGPEAPASYYRYTLELCEKLFEGEIEQSAFEEACRLMYGIRAFPIYSVDKLISTIIKHSHVANGDPRSQELIALLERDRATPVQTVRQQIAYRMHAEAIVGPDEPLFRIERSDVSRLLSIQLLGPDEPTLDEPLSPDQRWDSYRSSYALATPTELVGHAVAAPLLRRNLVAVADEHGLDDPQSGGPRDSAASVGGLHVRLVRPSCRIVYEAGGEDVVARLAPPSPALRDRTRMAAVRDAQRMDGFFATHGLSSR